MIALGRNISFCCGYSAICAFLVCGLKLDVVADMPSVLGPPVPLHTDSCLGSLAALNFRPHLQHGFRSPPPSAPDLYGFSAVQFFW